MLEIDVIRKITKISKDEDNKFSWIANYIINNLEVVPYLKIQELAKLTFTSPATINRFVKSLNIDGYKEMLHIIKYFKNQFKNDSKEPDKADESYLMQTYHSDITSIHDTFKMMLQQKTQLDLLAQKIFESKRVIILAVGGTYHVAADFSDKLLRLGFMVNKADGYHNGGYFLVNQPTKDANHTCVVVISYSGETADLIQLAKCAKKNSLPLFLISKNHKNSISEIADIQLKISSDESIVRRVSQSSRFALLFALDTLYGRIYNLDRDRFKNILKTTVIKKF